MDASRPDSRSDAETTPGSSFLPGLVLKLLAVMLIVGVLMGLTLPQMGKLEIVGDRVRALSQAKGIGLVLRLYASDHDGFYPASVNARGEVLRTSNDAFRPLFPLYVQSETIFGNARSAYQVRAPDNVITPPQEVLRAGENVYAYVMGLNDALNPALPIVADGTDGAGVGTYVSDPQARGGVWAGQGAIVVRLDSSAVVEMLSGPPQVRCIAQKFSDGTRRNLLGPAALGPGLKLLDPAVEPTPVPKKPTGPSPSRSPAP